GRDWAYARAESQAALFAWLSSLPCAVVNRLTADLWFRPRRPYPEWRRLFSQSGLPVLPVQITHDLGRAREFSQRYGGLATYTPMTSNTRYPIQDDQAWDQLARLLRVFPVCLIEGGDGPFDSAWLVDRDVIWSSEATLDSSDRRGLERG